MQSGSGIYGRSPGPAKKKLQVPENLRFYVDYERMARDMEICDVFTLQTGFEQVHVFWSH
ncbi:antirestriction protein ArdA [Parasulfitobacter algicola]|uniref:antirestriction protein ArdA n=1 Tax=Parasulfitobacter algicola TaxID=2614809 RepID=UPI0024844FDF|nr:antirestriction protein ArdA [Sulfitobacter algicola]